MWLACCLPPIDACTFRESSHASPHAEKSWEAWEWGYVRRLTTYSLLQISCCGTALAYASSQTNLFAFVWERDYFRRWPLCWCHFPVVCTCESPLQLPHYFTGDFTSEIIVTFTAFPISSHQHFNSLEVGHSIPAVFKGDIASIIRRQPSVVIAVQSIFSLCKDYYSHLSPCVTSIDNCFVLLTRDVNVCS